MEQAIKLLQALRAMTKDSSATGFTNAIYITPAQQMRNAADEIERKDRLLAEIDQFLKENK